MILATVFRNVCNRNEKGQLNRTSVNLSTIAKEWIYLIKNSVRTRWENGKIDNVFNAGKNEKKLGRQSQFFKAISRVFSIFSSIFNRE